MAVVSVVLIVVALYLEEFMNNFHNDEVQIYNNLIPNQRKLSTIKQYLALVQNRSSPHSNTSVSHMSGGYSLYGVFGILYRRRVSVCSSCADIQHYPGWWMTGCAVCEQHSADF